MKVLHRILSIVISAVVFAAVIFTGCTNSQKPDESTICHHTVQIGYCPECGEYVTDLSPQFSKIKDCFKKAIDEINIAEQDFADYKDSGLEDKASYNSGKQHMKNPAKRIDELNCKSATIM